MPVMQDQRLPLFQGIRLQFVRHFAERIFHERFLQDRFLRFRPAPENGFGKRYPRATTCRDRFLRDGLSQFPQFIKAAWSPFAVDSRIAFDEGLWAAAALFLGFHISLLL